MLAYQPGGLPRLVLSRCRHLGSARAAASTRPPQMSDWDADARPRCSTLGCLSCNRSYDRAVNRDAADYVYHRHYQPSSEIGAMNLPSVAILAQVL